jgi:hypothetical protein
MINNSAFCIATYTIFEQELRLSDKGANGGTHMPPSAPPPPPTQHPHQICTDNPKSFKNVRQLTRLTDRQTAMLKDFKDKLESVDFKYFETS